VGFQVKIQEVNVEFVKNGKNGYEVANVNYLYKGEAKTTKIMSFSNPQVFKDIQKMVGKTIDVETTQNGKYTNWAKVTLVSTDESPSVSSSSPTKPTSSTVRSTYETPEERAQRQLMIVRQSSISNALTYLHQTQPGGDYGVTDTLEVAQDFVDFVYGTASLPAADKLEDMDDDIPS